MGTVSAIATTLGSLVDGDNWVDEIEAWGEEVLLNRQYVDGDHRLEMTEEMAKMLRIEKDDDERFSLNYGPLVVNKLANRLIVEKITAVLADDEPKPEPVETGVDGSVVEVKTATDEANEWIVEVLDNTRFDELQIDVTRGAIGEGDSFAMIDPPNKEKGKDLVTFVHEPAWDGLVGIIPVYDRQRRNLEAAVKVWEEAGLGENSFRVNIYFADRVEKFVLTDETMTPMEGSPVDWLDNGEPLGVPFVPFKNDKKTGRSFGSGEPKKIRPAQDVLNRTYMSATMAAELAAFQRLVFIGMAAEANLSPGVIFEIVRRDEDGKVNPGIPNDVHVDVKVIEPGEISPFIDLMRFSIEQISILSDTPIPMLSSGASDSASGEALKQRESGLLAKVNVAQVKFGNAWEDLMKLAWDVQAAFGESGPEIKRYNTVWVSGEVRNNVETVENVSKLHKLGILDQKTTLELVAPAVEGLEVDDIDKIIEATKTATAGVLSQLPLDGFANLRPGRPPVGAVDDVSVEPVGVAAVN